MWQKVLEIIGHAAKSLEIISYSSCPHFWPDSKEILKRPKQEIILICLKITVFVESTGHIWNRTVYWLGFISSCLSLSFVADGRWVPGLGDWPVLFQFRPSWQNCQTEVVVVFLLCQTAVIGEQGYCCKAHFITVIYFDGSWNLRARVALKLV